MTDTDLIAAFLAKGGAVTVAPDGVAYGVDKAADNAKRDAAYLAARDGDYECRMDRRAELAHDFAFVGDMDAAIAARSGAFDQ